MPLKTIYCSEYRLIKLVPLFRMLCEHEGIASDLDTAYLSALDAVVEFVA